VHCRTPLIYFSPKKMICNVMEKGNNGTVDIQLLYGQVPHILSDKTEM